MGKNHKKMKEANDSIKNRGRIINIDFPSKAILIQFLADHLTYQYKKCFGERLNKDEYFRIQEESLRLKKALEKQLQFILKFCKKLKITNKSLILKIALKQAQINMSSEEAFKANIQYKVDGLEFRRIEYNG